MPVIQVSNVHKSYGNRIVLRNAGFSLTAGEYLALLGKNGSGKTTLLRAISGLLPIDHGTIHVLGHDTRDPKALRGQLGTVHQHSGLPERLAVDELLRIEARLRGLPRQAVNEALARYGLQQYEGSLVGSLSEGIKRRLAIAKALLHNPSVLLLDEPTIGLDPRAQREIWDYLLARKAEGTTAIVATNSLPEAQQLCDRVAFIDEGELLLRDSMQDTSVTDGYPLMYETTGPGEHRAAPDARA